ncbi:MAG: polysaccharide biosynthesis protein [Bacteroidales bacterium]|jgi:O-antigen/teichoic acid export membrane protein|nr:polysaccharide biosynthesis protein [Bacteroidales bacterium]
MGVIIRQSIKGTIVNYIGAFIGFLTTFFIAAKFLRPEEIGLVRILLEAGLLFGALSQLGINSSGIRFYPYFKDKENKDNGFFFWTIVIPLLGFILITALFIVLRNPISDFFSENSALFVEYYYFVIPLGFFFLYMVVFETNANVLMRIVVPKFIREVGIRTMTIVVYLLYAFRYIDLDWFVILLVSIYGIATLMNVFYLMLLNGISLKPNPSFITKTLRKDFLFYTSFLVLAAISGSIMGKIDVFLVSSKMGLDFTGIYSIAFYIAIIVEIPYRSLLAISLPEIAQSIKDKNFKNTNVLCQKVSLHQLLIACFIFALIWINIDFVFALLPNGDIYAKGKWVVFFIGLARLIDSSFGVSLAVLNFSKYYYYSLLFTFSLVILTVFTNLFFIPIYGMSGASLGTFLSVIVYIVLLLGFLQWKLKVTPLSFNLLKITGIVLLMLGISWGWEMTLSPLITDVFSNYTFALFINALLKTFVSLGIGVVLVYVFRVSEDVNSLARKYLGKIGIRI